MLTTVAAGRVFDFSFCIGMYGMAGQGFWSPQDFVLGPGGLIYLVNRGAEELGQRVTKCTLDHQFLGQFGGFGQGDGQFIWPRSIDLDGDGNVYISDEQLNRITVYDKDGAFLSKWGATGSGDGELKGPSGIAFDQDGNLLVVDSQNHRIQRFSNDGKFISAWGEHGSGDGQLDLPWGICLDKQGDVYVADWQNNRVQKFSAGGTFLAKFEGTATGVGSLNRPSGVAVDSEGDIYVTDWSNHRVQVYGADGVFVTTLVGDAQVPSPWVDVYIEANPDIAKARRRVNLEPEWRFRRPVAVNVDDQDRIFILESARHRIQVYDKAKEYEEAPINL